MRLAREYERAEGRDLRGFLAYAVQQDLAEAREGEAALESEGLDAVRLMTIHRAKGLEFPVVCVADLGRTGAAGRGRLLIGPDGGAGLRLATLAGGDPVPALGWEAIADGLAVAESAEERRLLYVAATRAEERLILSGGIDTARWPAPRPGGPPLDWLAPALLGDPAAVLGGADAAGGPATWADAADGPGAAGSGGRVVRCGEGAVVARLVTAATLPPGAAAPAPRERTSAPGTALPAEPKVIPAGGRPQPAQRRLSYSSLQDYARCGYRFYLGRVLGLPRVEAPPLAVAEEEAEELAPLEGRIRGSLVHRLLEELDFARPGAARRPRPCWRWPPSHGLELEPGQVEDIRSQVAAFAASPLCARLAAARGVRREAGFAFALEPDGGGPLVNGFIDVLAREPDGTVLVVDYKTDRLDEDDTPAALIERAYTIQRKVYALAALQEGAERVEVAYALTERPGEPVTATFAPGRRAGARRRAARASRPACSPSAWPVAERPHRELCGECPGRATLCSWPETMTLRPPEEAYAESAGTLAGSGGPS